MDVDPGLVIPDARNRVDVEIRKANLIPDRLRPCIGNQPSRAAAIKKKNLGENEEDEAEERRSRRLAKGVGDHKIPEVVATTQKMNTKSTNVN
jgi:hypothetical protein